MGFLLLFNIFPFNQSPPNQNPGSGLTLRHVKDVKDSGMCAASESEEAQPGPVTVDSATAGPKDRLSFMLVLTCLNETCDFNMTLFL